MLQTTAPNTDDPKTEDDFKALKALEGAKADALDAQARRIASQKALEKAQTADDPATAQLAAATQAAGIAAQQRALADSRAAILKNNFTVPDSGFTGDIKASDKAGGVEASLLAARALNIAAASILEKLGSVEKLKPLTNASIVLYGGADLPDFQPLIAFRAQSSALDKSLQDAMASIDKASDGAKEFLPPVIEFVSPAMIGAGLDAANKILGYFRTDYSIQGVSVNVDDLLLINALADALTKEKATVKVPALFNADALFGNSPILGQIDSLTTNRVALQQKVDLAGTTLDSLATVAVKETDTTVKAKIAKATADLKAASDQAKVTVSLYDGLLTKITTPDDKAKIPLAAIIQQDATSGLLGSGAKLMTAKISSTGGTYYTRKNLWSFFGTMPFFTMGGVVVNYTLFDGSSGVVLSAGAIPIDGGFFKVGRLPNC